MDLLRFFMYRIIRTFYRKHTLILYYHNICKPEDTEVNVLSPVVPLDIFIRQIDFINKSFNVISLDDCLASIKGETPMPDYSVVITFDDGYANHYKYAYPILHQRGLKATFFVSSAHIGANKLFWWDELDYMIMNSSRRTIDLKGEKANISIPLTSMLKRKQACHVVSRDCFMKATLLRRAEIIDDLRNKTGVNPYEDSDFVDNFACMDYHMVNEMMSSGFTFGSHSANHSILINESYDIQKKEILESTICLEAQGPLHFSYPNGLFDARIKKILISAGFVTGLTTRSGYVRLGDDPYELRRTPADAGYSEFVRRVSGYNLFRRKLKSTLSLPRRL